jgi:hypothetical protein
MIVSKPRVTGALLIAALAMGTAPNASADPVGSGSAAAFGATATITDQELIPPTPTAEVVAPPFGDDVEQTAIPIDADPLAVNGTLIARAAVHPQSDLESQLEQEASQHEVAAPYNARAVGQIEDLEVLIDAVEEDVPLLEADLIRGEAVAVCTGGSVLYSAQSEVVNLVIGGEDPLSGPLNDLVVQISEGLNASPLVDLVDIDVNVVTESATGTSVDALVITVLTPASDPQGLVQLRLGHAEVSGVACGEPPECSDAVDNDGDGLIDAADPHCHTDGNADNPGSYDPNDDSEAGSAVSDASALPSDGGALPKTGGAVSTGVAAALGAGALALFALRRELARF